VEQSGEDPGQVLPNPPGEVHERRPPGAGRSRAPLLAHHDCVGVRGRSPHAALCEEVGPGEARGDRGHPGELGRVAFGKVGGVLPRGVAGAREVSGPRGRLDERRSTSRAGVGRGRRSPTAPRENHRYTAPLSGRARRRRRSSRPSAVTTVSRPARSGPSGSKNFARVAVSRPTAAEISRPVAWSTTTVRERCPRVEEISSIPIVTSSSKGSRSALASATRAMIAPTVDYAIWVNSETAVVDDCTASRATRRSKARSSTDRVCPAP